MKLYKDGITLEAEGVEADKFRAAGYIEIAEAVKEPVSEPETEAVKEPKTKAK